MNLPPDKTPQATPPEQKIAAPTIAAVFASAGLSLVLALGFSFVACLDLRKVPTGPELIARRVGSAGALEGGNGVGGLVVFHAGSDVLIKDFMRHWSILVWFQLFQFLDGQFLEILSGDDRLIGLGLNVLARPAGHRSAIVCVLLQRSHAF